jgi:cobalt-zinc-cadmium resistance protein CzcA
MLERIIDLVAPAPLVVVLGRRSASSCWALALRTLPIDAFPDTTPVQVQVNTVAPALSPARDRAADHARVEQALSGLPGLTRCARSRSSACRRSR